ncbi:hypothetical protein ACEG17_03350 [Leptotrichia hongkongensis]|uniref:HTH crp-type domain-containing protein n=1 Tax=Leptotrichia hongkongensis TaxID=554406 RepID=A0ABV4S7G5_9FUSO|nr:hypothetical protein [Leptotrichia hongkongensis]
MLKNLIQFTNDKYKVLKFLYDNQIEVKNNKYIALSQQEIADILHFSKNKTNKIIQELKNDNFINNFNNTKGKYIITDNGNKVIGIIESNY